MRKNIFKLIGVGAALVLVAWAAGNQGQLGLAQAGGLPVRTLGFGEINSVVFSPDGQYLAVGTSGGSSVQLIETSIWRVVRTLEGHTWSVNSVAFSPNGRLLASGSADKTIKLWEVATGSVVRILTGHTGSAYSVAFSPDGGLLASGSCGQPLTQSPWCTQGEIKLWDVATGREVRTLSGHTNWVGSVAFSPDGRLLASGSYDTTIKLWEVSGM